MSLLDNNAPISKVETGVIPEKIEAPKEQSISHIGQPQVTNLTKGGVPLTEEQQKTTKESMKSVENTNKTSFEEKSIKNTVSTNRPPISRQIHKVVHTKVFEPSTASIETPRAPKSLPSLPQNTAPKTSHGPLPSIPQAADPGKKATTDKLKMDLAVVDHEIAEAKDRLTKMDLKGKIKDIDKQIKEKEDQLDKEVADTRLEPDKMVQWNKEQIMKTLNKDISKLLIEKSKIEVKNNKEQSQLTKLELKSSVLNDRINNKDPKATVTAFINNLSAKGMAPRQRDECLRELKSLLSEFRKTDNFFGPDAMHTFGMSILKGIDQLETANKAEKTALAATKTSTAAKILSAIKHIAQGKAKHVWINIENDDLKGKAFYTPVKMKEMSFIEALKYFPKWLVGQTKEAEIRDEVKTAHGISKDLAELNITGETHLAIDYEIQEGEHKIGNAFTVKTDLAGLKEGDRVNLDMEQKVRNNPFGFPQSAEIGHQIIKGMKNLHATERLQGDFKLENILVFQKGKQIIVRISDWGKTKKVEGDKQVMHSGNARFAPPEGRISKKGEVYSVALALIRNMEGEFLKSGDKAMLMSPDHPDASADSSKREGIEKYLIQSKDCPQSESAGIKGNIKVYTRTGKIEAEAKLGIPSSEDLSKAQKAVHKYIDALEKELSSDPSNNPTAIKNLCKLLKKMTRSNPDARPTMQEVEKEYTIIMNTLSRSKPAPQ